MDNQLGGGYELSQDQSRILYGRGAFRNPSVYMELCPLMNFEMVLKRFGIE
jgi:hypothetical protein